jgi:L-amino acid N-acyltransferase YncA
MTAPETAIRIAGTADAARIAEIYAPYVRDTAISFETAPPTAGMMAERISTTLAMYPWLVADTAGETTGFAYAGKHRDRPGYRWSVETTVYVSSAIRHKGIGRALYGSLLQMLKGQGFRSAFAEIVLPNPASVRLHKGLGFMPIGVHPEVGFKLGRWQDIGYWRVPLADCDGEPADPIPFSLFRQNAAVAAAFRAESR